MRKASYSKILAKATSGVLLLLFIFTVLPAPLSVNADAPVPAANSLTLYCEKITPSKLHATCQDSNLMQQARNVATNYCSNVSAQSMASCVESKAESFVKQAADSKPADSSAFSAKLTSILKSTGYNLNTATQASQQGLPPDVTCGGSNCQDPAVKCTKSQCDLVAKYVNPAINLLAAVFGAVAVISVIMGGIQYSTSEGDPQKSSKAKDRIQNTLLAVIAFIFLYAFLQFLVPGGLFNRSIG